MKEEEIEIRRKIQIRVKQKVGFRFKSSMNVKLFWSSDTDLDLCLFYKRKNGEESGIFSDEYRQDKTYLGVEKLDRFPFMYHSGDQKKPKDMQESLERIDVANLDEIDEAYICIVNYEAAVNGQSVTFQQHNGNVVLATDNGDYLEVACDSDKQGVVFVVAKIKNEGDEYSLQNENEVMSLGKAWKNIPGFKLICEDV